MARGLLSTSFSDYRMDIRSILKAYHSFSWSYQTPTAQTYRCPTFYNNEREKGYSNTRFTRASYPPPVKDALKMISLKNVMEKADALADDFAPRYMTKKCSTAS